MAKLSHGFAAGAAAGLLQGILLALVSELGLFLLMGLGLQLTITRFWFYQHVTWGGLWGLLLVVPVLPLWSGWLRGAGLALGPLMPVVVIVFNVLWGVLAGLWWDLTVGRALPEAQQAED
ncbi:MAG TPA: hypothetical protein VL359_15870 [bacterium]|nr:hypothetical protein [bacterium]